MTWEVIDEHHMDGPSGEPELVSQTLKWGDWELSMRWDGCCELTQLDPYSPTAFDNMHICDLREFKKMIDEAVKLYDWTGK